MRHEVRHYSNLTVRILGRSLRRAVKNRWPEPGYRGDQVRAVITQAAKQGLRPQDLRRQSAQEVEAVFSLIAWSLPDSKACDIKVPEIWERVVRKALHLAPKAV